MESKSFSVHLAAEHRQIGKRRRLEAFGKHFRKLPRPSKVARDTQDTNRCAGRVSKNIYVKPSHAARQTEGKSATRKQAAVVLKQVATQAEYISIWWLCMTKKIFSYLAVVDSNQHGSLEGLHRCRRHARWVEGDRFGKSRCVVQSTSEQQQLYQSGFLHNMPLTRQLTLARTGTRYGRRK